MTPFNHVEQRILFMAIQFDKVRSLADFIAHLDMVYTRSYLRLQMSETLNHPEMEEYKLPVLLGATKEKFVQAMQDYLNLKVKCPTLSEAEFNQESMFAMSKGYTDYNVFLGVHRSNDFL